MNKETTLQEPELPQLRQMVLENTKRINRNETMINRVLMENAEHSKKLSEHDEWAERSRREHDRWMRSMRQTLDEIAQISKGSEKRLEEMVKKTDAQIEKTDALIKETAVLIKETDAQIKETDALIKETAVLIKETQKHLEETRKQVEATSLEVKQLSRQLTGTTGHIAEGLVSSSVEKIFKAAGLELQNSGKNLIRKLKAENIGMEVDVLLSGETMVVPIEVKANFTKDNVIRFLHQMSLFRKLFPEFADKEVVAAVAAINYEKEVAEYAHKEGLLVIRVSSDDIFSLDPFKLQSLRRF